MNEKVLTLKKSYVCNFSFWLKQKLNYAIRDKRERRIIISYDDNKKCIYPFKVQIRLCISCGGGDSWKKSERKKRISEWMKIERKSERSNTVRGSECLWGLAVVTDTHKRFLLHHNTCNGDIFRRVCACCFSSLFLCIFFLTVSLISFFFFLISPISFLPAFFLINFLHSYFLPCFNFCFISFSSFLPSFFVFFLLSFLSSTSSYSYGYWQHFVSPVPESLFRVKCGVARRDSCIHWYVCPGSWRWWKDVKLMKENWLFNIPAIVREAHGVKR